MRSDRKMAEWVWDVGTRTRLPRLHPIFLGYLATESSNLHMEQEEGVVFCQYAQAGDRAHRLENPHRSTDSVASFQMICSKHWPVI